MFQQILYYLIIFPIYLLIECSFMCIYLCTDNPILAILIVSILVNIFCLPFYLGADKIYERNIEIQNKMKEKITSIKKNFKGKEKFFLISEVYKQYNYSPFLNFKSILGIIVQVPFFIAAYSFFSHLTEISNISFLFINDLQKPDNILNFNDITINILPIIMTIINIISSEIYIRTLKINKRISIYATSLIFLVLLYNSPSCLVIYWIFNNIFYLIKNIIIFFQKSKKLENKNHYEEIYKKNYNVITILCSLCFCFLFSITFTLENSNYLNNVFFISFINFITNILCLSFGMFFLYPITFYYYLNTKNKRIMAYTIFGFLCCSLLNFIILNRIENCASFDPFNFLQWTNCTHSSLSIIASYIILLSVTLFTFMLQKNSKNTLHTQKTIIISIIVILSSILSYDIIKLHKTIKNKDTHRITPLSINGTPIGKISNNIELSKDKKNIILFFLDSASSYSMNLLLKDEPSFKNYFDGFTFFQETISPFVWFPRKLRKALQALKWLRFLFHQ